jgi:hypothetical protein
MSKLYSIGSAVILDFRYEGERRVQFGALAEFGWPILTRSKLATLIRTRFWQMRVLTNPTYEYEDIVNLEEFTRQPLEVQLRHNNDRI